MDNQLYRKLGIVTKKELDCNFDSIYEQYKIIAIKAGYNGDLKFVKERGKIMIYVPKEDIEELN